MANKCGVAAGHYNGANKIPSDFWTKPEFKAYSEGTRMWTLGQKIVLAHPSIYNARPEAGSANPWTPDWKTRASRFKANNVNYAFELHTNWSTNSKGKPNRGLFTVIVSLCYEAGVNQATRCAEEKALAVKLWKPLCDQLGLKWDLRTKKGSGKWDWYSFINECKKKGIAHPMIIEHGYHMDFAENEERYMKTIVDYYGKVLEMIGVSEPAQPSQPQIITATKDCYTLWSMHKKYNCDIEDILLLNGKKPNPYAIRIGDKFQIVRQ